MTVTITFIRLRSLWHFFKLSFLALKIVGQTKNEKGFIKMKNTGFGYMHYTMSLWQTEEDAKRFARSGAHANAMKAASQISREVRIFTVPGVELPGWKEARQLVMEKGKVFSF